METAKPPLTAGSLGRIPKGNSPTVNEVDGDLSRADAVYKHLSAAAVDETPLCKELAVMFTGFDSTDTSRPLPNFPHIPEASSAVSVRRNMVFH
jgi:hypothetical protein